MTIFEITNNIFLLYLLFFIWSFWDAFILTNMFIHWEFFFLAGWFIIAEGKLNPYAIIFLLFIWAILWDHISYFLWKKYWKKVFKKDSKFLNFKNLERWKEFFKKYWEKTILISRLLWPVSRIIPFISAIFWIKYKTFVFYNFIWIILWISQFILYWYTLWIWADYLWFSIIINCFLSLLAIIFIIFAYKKFNKKNLKKSFYNICKIFIIYIILFFFTVFIYFFHLYPKYIDKYNSNEIIENIEQYILEKWRLIHSDNIIKTYSNPINLVIITDKNIENVFSKINWIENKSFSSGEISFKKYLNLIKKKQPPISDFYYNNFVQNYQFQNKTWGNIYRQHIRLWEIWQTKDFKKIYIASVSKDDWLTIMINNGLFIPAHDIDYEIDKSRDNFIDNLRDNFSVRLSEYKMNYLEKNEYKTDWIIKQIEF